MAAASMPNKTTSLPVPQAWDLEPDLAAVPPARRLILETARCWQVPLSEDALWDIGVCASELLANAVECTRARCRVTLRWTGERLRVEVADPSRRRPRPGAAPETATAGRGLLLVEHLSHAWGWEPQGAGKTVWFEFSVNAARGIPDPAGRGSEEFSRRGSPGERRW